MIKLKGNLPSLEMNPIYILIVFDPMVVFVSKNFSFGFSNEGFVLR